MFAARQRAGCMARQLQRSVRNYASEAHGHHKTDAPVNESFGAGSIATAGIFFGCVAFYQFVPKKGETSVISDWIAKYQSRAEDWEEINALHTKAVEQAGFDRNLFENAGNKHRYVEVTYPEAFGSHAPRNIQAGQLINLDHVVEHYRQQHLQSEERKLKALAEKQQE
ncbi:NADH-ubiquinone oxidoreductase 17.8 kDa subunit [Stachybotrys elegans]|uniref:NADH-ubiquinone oxidoreductase 17.8 kDa subunit n=1 Tax=Stachybotrys elegans TaxID=80388 RepID=A0A8K0T2C0_9HYPO|nr:NADH-ubiquinone oxidoreductase 17.8 kDa subunit [Stachybotrys elegans]